MPGDDDWPAWCRGENFQTSHLAVEHAVTLAPDACILHVTTPDALRALTVAVAHPDSTWTDYHVDWPALAERYDGIVIAPYQWQARLDDDCFWYYSWDCASGCIWNLDAIGALTVLTRDPLGRSRSRV